MIQREFEFGEAEHGAILSRALARSPLPSTLAITKRGTESGKIVASQPHGAPMKKYFGLLALLACSVHAATVYKTVGADGKVVYTDQPPADPTAAKALRIKDEATTPLPESVSKYQEQLTKSMQNRLREPAPKRSDAVVLFSASWCGYCRQAKRFLQGRQIAFQEQDIDTESGMRAFIKAGGGGGGVPLLVAAGRATRGFSEATYAQVFAKPK
jgi:glutaredoxin